MVIFLKHLVNTVIFVTLYSDRLHLHQKQIGIFPHSLEESNLKMILSISVEVYKANKNILSPEEN